MICTHHHILRMYPAKPQENRVNLADVDACREARIASCRLTMTNDVRLQSGRPRALAPLRPSAWSDSIVFNYRHDTPARSSATLPQLGLWLSLNNTHLSNNLSRMLLSSLFINWRQNLNYSYIATFSLQY